MKKILISTGGTGGHVIPAEIIGDHLKDDYNIFYSTDKRGLKYSKFINDKTFIIDTPKLKISLSIVFDIMKLLYLFFQSIFYLKREKIDKVISIGGYMSLPVIIGAKFLGLKIYLIEPNLILGRGNRFFLNFSEKIFCYSKELANFPEKFRSKIELIKPLVSKAYYKIKKKENINKKFCFLISGGSQGAKIFDIILKDVMTDLSKKFSIKVIQQTYIENIDNLKKFYNLQNIENEIFSFEKNFINLIDKSDLCITRAGATSLAELSILNKPFIAIPLPSAKDNHQMKNAIFYKNLGCCWILDQKNLNQDILFNMLYKILNDNSDFLHKKSNLKKFNSQNSWNVVNQKLKEVINEN